MNDKQIVSIISLSLSCLLGIMIGSYSVSAPTTTYNNLDIIREQLQVTQKCFSGWDSTLDVLRACNNLNK